MTSFLQVTFFIDCKIDHTVNAILAHSYCKKVTSLKVCIQGRWSIRSVLISGFCSLKQLATISTPSMDSMLVYGRVTPSIQFTSNHLYTWVERGTVRVKCLAQEHNTMPRPGNKPKLPNPELSEHTNHDVERKYKRLVCSIVLQQIHAFNILKVRELEAV